MFASANLCYPTTRLHSYFSTVFAAHLHVYTRTTGCKRGLTSRRTCTYVLVTEKNRLICKRRSRYTCDFITEFQGCRDPTIRIGMHIILCVRTVCLHVCIHTSRVTCEGLAHVHSPCKCCRFSPFSYIVYTCCKIHSHVPCLCINPLYDL